MSREDFESRDESGAAWFEFDRADADRHPDFDPSDVGNYERPSRAGSLSSWRSQGGDAA